MAVVCGSAPKSLELIGINSKLFDRRDPASVLWPRRATFEALLDVLNTTVWSVDSVTGRLGALRTGEARIWINYAGIALSSTSFTAEVLVHVR